MTQRTQRLSPPGNFRLQQHVMRGVARGRNYAPDTTYELVKAGRAGPHSICIAEILAKWAALWAADAEAARDADIDFDADQAWRDAMREADAEVDRYLDANELPRALPCSG